MSSLRYLLLLLLGACGAASIGVGGNGNGNPFPGYEGKEFELYGYSGGHTVAIFKQDDSGALIAEIFEGTKVDPSQNAATATALVAKSISSERIDYIGTGFHLAVNLVTTKGSLIRAKMIVEMATLSLAEDLFVKLNNGVEEDSHSSNGESANILNDDDLQSICRDKYIRESIGPSCIFPNQGASSAKVLLINSDGSSQEFTQIQPAINAALPGSRINIGQGHWDEELVIFRKQNLIIDGQCQLSRIKSIAIAQSSFIEVRGLHIYAQNSSFGKAVVLGGGIDVVSNVEIADNLITGNTQKSGLAVGPSSSHIKIANNFISGLGGDGISFSGESGGGSATDTSAHHCVISNIISSNSKHGINVGRLHHAIIRKNLVIANGTASGPWLGIFREGVSGSPQVEGITLLQNGILANGKDIGAQILDSTDGVNYSSSGIEGFLTRRSPLSNDDINSYSKTDVESLKLLFLEFAKLF